MLQLQKTEALEERSAGQQSDFLPVVLVILSCWEHFLGPRPRLPFVVTVESILSPMSVIAWLSSSPTALEVKDPTSASRRSTIRLQLSFILR